MSHYPDSKAHGANMGPTWVLSAPDGPHVGPMSLAIRVVLVIHGCHFSISLDRCTSILTCLSPLNLHICRLVSSVTKKNRHINMYAIQYHLGETVCTKCLKLSQKSCRSSCLESQIINIKLKKNQQNFPVLLQRCRPRTGGPVRISSTACTLTESSI